MAIVLERKIKRIFVAHPISGDIEGNHRRVVAICARIHTKYRIPYAPYLVSLLYLDDTEIEDRRLGMEANHEMLRSGFITELWLYGRRISNGMWAEIKLARKAGIPVIAKTRGTQRDLEAGWGVIT